MSVEKSEQISIKIDRKLAHLPKTFGPQCIFKVHQALRRQNNQAYEPEMIAIGPYHHGKKKLKKMEKYKLKFVEELLERKGDSSVKKYIEALTDLEGEARKCYAEEIGLSTDEFVEMMFLDGCFIIELFREYDTTKARTKDDPLLGMQWFRINLRRDLLLFENQLPFFVLSKLFELSRSIGERDLIPQAIFYLNGCSFSPYNQDDQMEPSITNLAESFHHLLGLMHEICCSSFSQKLNKADQESKNKEEEKEPRDFAFIKSATDLEISGVKLRKAKEYISWLDISFDDGKLRIPPLFIGDTTECLFRNLIAYEEYMCDLNYQRKNLTDYVRFMDCLINTAEDVKKLRHYGLVNNWLGDDETVAIMFNKIGNDVIIDPDRFCYLKIFGDINKHCKRRRNAWMAYLTENYFSNPWSIISFLAAFALLVLTFLQSVFAILH